MLPGITRAAYRQRSPAGAAVMSEWATIVGPRLAAETEPRRLARGVLTVTCAGPVAMELQHLAPVLMERINTFAGGRVVEAIRFVQGEVTRVPAPAVPAPAAPVPVEGVAEGELNAALGRLLGAMRARRRG